MTTKTNSVAEGLRRLLSEHGMETLMEGIRRSEEEHKDSERLKLESGMFYMLLRCTVEAGGCVWLGRKMEEFKRFGLDDEARREWKIKIVGQVRGDDQ